MIEQQGQVISVSGNLVSVRLGGNSGCVACDAGRGCGAGIFGRLLRRKPAVLDLDNAINARVGQPVVVGLPESVFLRLVFHLYMLPLLAGLAGAVLGQPFVGLIVAGAMTHGVILFLIASTWRRESQQLGETIWVSPGAELQASEPASLDQAIASAAPSPDPQPLAAHP